MGTENKKKEVPSQGKCSLQSTSSVENATEVSSDTTVYVPITINENDVISGARELLREIRAHWDLEHVKFKLFTDGITNKLVGCFYNGNHENSKNNNVNGESNSQDQDSNNDEMDIVSATNNVVLVRIYGNKTDLLIDRNAETKNIKLLHNYGFAPSLFAVFNNGLAYEYVPGATLTPDTVLNPEIWPLVATRMAEMHKVKCGSHKKREPMLWTKMQQFFDLIPNEFSDPKKQERLKNTFLPVTKIRDEFNTLYSRLKELNSPIVFSHNDLLLGNVIYTKSLNRVTFIDYEYADYNFQAFDIGNHFTEFAGIGDADHSKYPSKEYQIAWLTVYLKSYLETDHVDAKLIEKLYVQVNQFALASHFLWAVWSLIQAQHSTIDFDFANFALSRYNQYLAQKETFLALKYEDN